MSIVINMAKNSIKSYGERYICVFVRAKIKKKILLVLFVIAILSIGVLWASGI